MLFAHQLGLRDENSAGRHAPAAAADDAHAHSAAAHQAQRVEVGRREADPGVEHRTAWRPHLWFGLVWFGIMVGSRFFQKKSINKNVVYHIVERCAVHEICGGKGSGGGG